MSSETPLEFEKTRSFKRILSDTFLFLREHFVPLGTALLVIAGPFLLVTALYSTTFLIKILATTPPGSQASLLPDLENLKPYVLYNYVFIFITSIIIAAVVFEYVVLYIDQGSGPVRLNVIVEHLKHDFLHILGAGFMSGIFVMFGLFLFVLPGIYLSVILAPIFMVVLYERLPVADSFSRCFRLVSGNWWNTFLMLFILVILQSLLALILALPQSVVSAQATAAMTSNGIPANYQLWLLLTSVISSISYLLYAIPMVAVAFHYFNLEDLHPFERPSENNGQNSL